MSDETKEERTCYYCELPIEDGEKAIEATTKNAWAHFTCWYDGGPFEREVRERKPANMNLALEQDKHAGPTLRRQAAFRQV